jgi:hypothetical protein
MTGRSEHRVRLVVNWILAVLTAPAALFVLLFGFAAAMGTDRCAYEDCPRMGPPVPVMTLLVFGAPLVSLATIIATIRTARMGLRDPVGGVRTVQHRRRRSLPVVQAVTAFRRNSPAR